MSTFFCYSKCHIFENCKATLGETDFSEHFRSEINQMKTSSLYFISGDFANYYEELETLGQGCSGIVKKCRSIKSGEVVAVKITNSNSDEENIILVCF